MIPDVENLLWIIVTIFEFWIRNPDLEIEFRNPMEIRNSGIDGRPTPDRRYQIFTSLVGLVDLSVLD